MSTYELTPAEQALDHETRQPALWGSLIAFIIINNIAIFTRIWTQWGMKSNGRSIIEEDVFVSGIFRPLLSGALVQLMSASSHCS